MATAAPGDLDPGFAEGGLATLGLGTGDSISSVIGVEMASTPGGKVAVAYGVPTSGGFDGFSVRRYLADGSIDPTFDGEAAFFAGHDALVRDVIVQPDGKVVVAATNFSEPVAFAIARYNEDGSLDTSFSEDGKTVVSFAGAEEAAFGTAALALTSDGRIVVARATDFETRLARLLPDGTLDASFSGDGQTSTGVPGGSGVDLAIQEDDKVVVALSDSGFVVQRYATDGTLDASFGGDGQVETEFGPGFTAAGAVAVQSDGAILVAGEHTPLEASSDFAVARYTAAGAPDTSFSEDGALLVDLEGTVDSAELIGLQEDGKIVVGGQAVDAESGPAFFTGLVRLTSAGQLDATFSGDGKRLVAFGGDEDQGLVLSSDATGLLLGGRTEVYYVQARGLGGQIGEQWNTRPVPAFARLNLDGTADTGFGDEGIVRSLGFTSPDTTADYAASSLVLGDERIVTAGSSNVESTTDDFAAVRLEPDGGLDPAFSADGRASVDFGPESNDYARAVLAAPESKLLLAGTRYRDALDLDDIGGDFALARLNGDGSPDATFSGDGRVTTDLGGHDRLLAAAMQSDGKVVAVGDTGGPFGPSELALARYNADGSLDTGFSGDGIQTTSVEASAVATAVAIQPSGKIVVAGISFDGLETSDGFVTRYNADGTPDGTFADEGLFDMELSSGADHVALAMREDGSLVAAASSFAELALRGLTADGEADFSFAGGSVEGLEDLSSFALTFDADGRLLVGGGTGEQLKLARLLTDGQPDESYGSEGVSAINVGEPVVGADLDTQGDAAIVTGYAGGSPLETDMLLARVQGGDGAPPPDRTLTVSVEGPGTVTGEGINCGAGGSDCTETYPHGTEVTLSQAPSTDASFDGWGGDAAGCAGSQFCPVLMDEDRVASASFQADEPQPSPEEPSSSPSPPPAPPPPSGIVPPIGSVQISVAVAAKVVPVKGARALLRLRCHSQTACRGVAKLVGRVRLPARARRSAKRVRNVVLGQSRFGVPAGKASVLRVRLNRKGRRLLRRAGRRGLRARLVGRGLRNRAVRLKPKRNKRRNSRSRRR